MENGLGLGDVLQGDVPVKEAILSVSPNLWLLTSGRPPARPAELLQSKQMSDLLAKQSELFDFVLVDCRPSSGLADTLAIAPFVDAVLLVAQRREDDPKGALMHAVDQLGQVGAVVRGGVLNNVAPSKRGGMDGFGYTYGYGYGASSPDDEAESPGRRPAVLSGHRTMGQGTERVAGATTRPRPPHRGRQRGESRHSDGSAQGVRRA